MNKIYRFRPRSQARSAYLSGLRPGALLMTQPHDAATAMVLAGGLFTVAIAVLIRD